MEQEMGSLTFAIIILGKKIDKSLQCSSWDERPLSKPQIIYAALDTIIAINLYNKLKDNISFSPKQMVYKSKSNLSDLNSKIRNLHKSIQNK